MAGFKAHITDWAGFRCFPYIVKGLEDSDAMQNRLTVIVRRFCETKGFDYVEINSSRGNGIQLIALKAKDVDKVYQINHWLDLLGWDRF